MSRIIGFDPGTMFFQVAEKNNNGEIEFKSMRNSFVELLNYDSQDIEEILKQNKWQYVSDGQHFFVIGEDSLKCSLIFPGIELRRPMQDGVLNKGEEKKMIVIAKIIESLIGREDIDDDSLVCFCTSGKSIDNDVDDKFHAARLGGFFERLGLKTKKIDEGLAVVLSERPTMIDSEGLEVPYTGIGISFGSGKVNAVLAYKGLSIISMSSTRAGDYIDKMVAENTDLSLSKIAHIKETKLDFSKIDQLIDDDAIFALNIYYQNLIEYTFRNLAKEFKKVRSDFSGPIDICLAGGTASPPGFKDKVESVVRSLDLPFDIKEIKISKNPKNSVAKGLLTQAIISQKKLKEKDIDKMLD
jgi:hypothetical protein